MRYSALCVICLQAEKIFPAIWHHEHVSNVILAIKNTESTMNYCSECGASVALAIPAGDNRPRHVCANCGMIHYENPKLVVGAIPEWEDSILLCRRAIEPRYGKWTLPAGFMETRESTAKAASRETLEEASAQIEIGEMFTLIDVPAISQVYIFYRARLLDTDFHPGEESLETALFPESRIPWDDIAFHTVSLTLRHYFADRANGVWRFHTMTLPMAYSSNDV